MKNRKRRGFTFAELMVVLAVMGILMMAAIPQFQAYIRSIEIAEAKFNHQTIVYCMREWTLGSRHKLTIPGSFTAKNAKGKSVADYLEHYNNEYYRKYLEAQIISSPTTPIITVGISSNGTSYKLERGILTTTVHIGDPVELRYDSLNNMPDADRDKYIQD